MKQYIIHCNEEQLRLMRSALELQMRVRIGQGWAITENLIDYRTPEYLEHRGAYDGILDCVLNNIVSPHPRNWVNRDMWIGCENALGVRIGEIGLSEYGLMKVEEVSECD